jgi:hypothetical protein
MSNRSGEMKNLMNKIGGDGVANNNIKKSSQTNKPKKSNTQVVVKKRGCNCKRKKKPGYG